MDLIMSSALMSRLFSLSKGLGAFIREGAFIRNFTVFLLKCKHFYRMKDQYMMVNFGGKNKRKRADIHNISLTKKPSNRWISLYKNNMSFHFFF
jgi:hypothetical protein